jgi:hypothetical protein
VYTHGIIHMNSPLAEVAEAALGVIPSGEVMPLEVSLGVESMPECEPVVVVLLCPRPLPMV